MGDPAAGATYDLPAEADTLRLGAELASRVRGGEILCLLGPLGSGKTTLVKGFVRALGHKGPVRSPTFGLIHEYRRLRPRVYHMDFFRLKPRDLPNLGLPEIFGRSDCVCLVEWPGAARAEIPGRRWEVRLSHARGASRRACLRRVAGEA
jgi:tRNA threonylcarbamoyladenosine biosynthesis protein TsaE